MLLNFNYLRQAKFLAKVAVVEASAPNFQFQDVETISRRYSEFTRARYVPLPLRGQDHESRFTANQSICVSLASTCSTEIDAAASSSDAILLTSRQTSSHLAGKIGIPHIRPAVLPQPYDLAIHGRL
jgi:hypothetical protein